MSSRLHGLQRFWQLGAAVCLGAFVAVAEDASVAIRSVTHWAFQPLAKPAVPSIRNSEWPKTLLDRFILARLEDAGMQSSPPTDKRTLLRRATFNLIGLPPTPQEIAAFEADGSPHAFDAVIERLLASPHYGERWGRHWMDVVRYADTAGDNADYPIPEAHLYRDYIIDAFNADKPFDQFIHEQLAGDILAQRFPEQFHPQGIVATGFLALSRRYGTGPFELWHLTLENTLETVGQAFLGLNLKCARCHDHKFDPVTMKDYYGLYGIFASTEFPWAGSEEIQSKNFNRQNFVPLARTPEAESLLKPWQAHLETLRREIARLETSKPGEKSTPEDHARTLAARKKELRTLEKPGSPASLPVAYAVREGKIADTMVHLRGEPSTPGNLVPRCAPAFLPEGTELKIPSGSSGRLEFAQWLTQANQSLTARVLVNRVWAYHFGHGLVSTPNNLGLRSDPPWHRELLDCLAAYLVENRWSVKSVHRLILKSAVFQLSSQDVSENREVDPSNQRHWRFDRHRLEAESIRDALLAVSGRLQLNRPGPHPFPPPERWTWTQHNPFKERYESHHRSVYLMTQRLQKHPFLALFDGPDTNNSTESRRASTVPQQALFAMNHPFVEEQARHLAHRVYSETATDKERMDLMAYLTWGRPLKPDEQVRFNGWLNQATLLAADSGLDPAQSRQEAWTSLAMVTLTANEFLYVD